MARGKTFKVKWQDDAATLKQAHPPSRQAVGGRLPLTARLNLH